MKYLLPILLVVVSFSGFSCLEAALQYPKEYSTSPRSLNNPTKEKIDLLGVISALDLVIQTFNLTLDNGSVEEIIFNNDTVFSSENGQQNLAKLQDGFLVSLSGEREPSSLITTANSIRQIEEKKIIITSPEEFDTITSQVIIKGFSNLQTNKIFWRIKDSTEVIKFSGVSQITTQSNSFIPLQLEIFLPALNDNDFSLEIFSKTPTGQEENLVILPLHLFSTSISTFDVYFANQSQKNCNGVFPVSRTVAETSAVGRAALLEILNGPTTEEQKAGYRTRLLESTTIKSFVISGGVATVTVSKDWEKNNACDKQLAEEQIKETLLQIDLVREVEIKIEN